MPGQTRRNFTQAAHRIEATYRAQGENTVSGLRMIGEEIMTDVKASRPGAGVPKDTGNLADTGRVDGPRTGGSGRPEITLSFGGPAAPYALRQHEELQWHHELGEARYLIRGIERWRGNGTSVKRALAGMLAAIHDPNRSGGQQP